MVPVAVPVWVGVAVFVEVLIGVAVAVEVFVAVGVLVFVGVLVLVAVPVPVFVAVEIPVLVLVEVAVGVLVAVAVLVLVCVDGNDILLSNGVAVAVGVGVEDDGAYPTIHRMPPTEISPPGAPYDEAPCVTSLNKKVFDPPGNNRNPKLDEFTPPIFHPDPQVESYIGPHPNGSFVDGK